MASPRSRNYTCSICQKSFERSSHCYRHKETHTKERPFNCARCPKRYCRRDALQRHEKLDHDKEETQQHQLDPKSNMNISTHSISSPYIPLFSQFNTPTETKQPDAQNYPLSPPRNTTFDIVSPMDCSATISDYERLLRCEEFFPSVGNFSTSNILGRLEESPGALLGCNQAHDSLSPLPPSPMDSPASILQSCLEGPDSDQTSLLFMKMFDPLLDPGRARQEAVRSYMAEIGSVPEYHVHTTAKFDLERNSHGAGFNY